MTLLLKFIFLFVFLFFLYHHHILIVLSLFIIFHVLFPGISQHINVHPVQLMMTLLKSFVQCGNVNLEKRVQNGKPPEFFSDFSRMWGCCLGLNEYPVYKNWDSS